MFPELQKKFIRLYTFSTGMILTFILIVTFFLYLASQFSRREISFSDHVLTLSSKLQTEPVFADSYLAQLEAKYSLLIYIEENGTPFFFPGAYKPRTDRQILFKKIKDMAADEGIYHNSNPITSNLLQSSIMELTGMHNDSYLGCLLITQTSSGYKKLILIQDITGSQLKLIKNGILYLLTDILGIFLLFLTGRNFVRRSLKPLEEMYLKQQDFAASASHELRSPLAVIQAAADAAIHTPGQQKKFLNIIKDECQRGNSLIKNLLLLSSARQENWSINMQYFELDEMLFHLMELYEPLCSAKDGTILLVLPEETLPPVYADPDLCLQIFTILLDNAIAYALPAAGKIVLSAVYSHSCTTVCVTDFGPGISDEEKTLIFDPFYQQDKSRNKKAHFGLGLSIAAKLAKLQNIKLHVKDTKGGGSTFEVIFR
ncbi:MAG: HAMP domain-containing histidine kinase [Dorea sp.]|jgi:signal transduction histidine kinase|nr:HAMP domain-containing histidine kinase [Dorea sp.]